ncbi:hypothetical protein CUJ83_04580 [Methanocella sp. CWC-04]|uniref:MoaB/Mog domain-containing protein n=1 Tax=Methanooceanicella nereidis TaxID=2052831 RepID=A0AAP2RDK9_9EURY|nr:molybdopterin molybdotransferase MoeA [Methanocella sp. CWC-04]MCD1294272.1 hypothetical protein [Methanocella sp. CWC-04]
MILAEHDNPVMPENGRMMVPIKKAYEMIDKMREKFFLELPVEKISLKKALNRRLASDVISAISSPMHNISIMDGYAISTSDRYPLALQEDIYAGDEPGKVLGKGKARYVATGAFVPEGADAVLKIEDAVIEDDMLKGISLEPWTHIVKAGSDFKTGETILYENSVIRPQTIGILHATGVSSIEAYKKIKVAVVSTGNEIKNGMTKDTNAPMVCAMLETWGCEPEHIGVIPDNKEETVSVIEQVTKDYDMVVTIGGVSVGKKDFIVSTIIEGGSVVFHGYRIRPGKPLLVSYYNDKPVFSLPGKPTGAYTAMELIVRRFIMGETRRVKVDLPVSKDIEFYSKGFDYIVYVEIRDGKAVPLGYEGSSLELFSGRKYGVSIISASPRSLVADGYFMARDNLKEGENVTVNLL